MIQYLLMIFLNKTSTQSRLIHLRWLSILIMFIAALMSSSVLGSNQLTSILLAFATVIASINICLQLALSLIDHEKPMALFSPLFQLSFDFLYWAGYLYLSGGAINPLISIFMPLVAIGALVLNQIQAWSLGAVAIFMYSFLLRHHKPLYIENVQKAGQFHLLGMWLVFSVSTVVIIWFILQMIKTITEQDRVLAENRERMIKNDWLVSIGSLAAGTAHELSTPLSTLKFLVDDLLEDHDLPERFHADFLIMSSQIERCKQALTQLTEKAEYSQNNQHKLISIEPWLMTMLNAWSSLNPIAELNHSINKNVIFYQMPFDLSIERAITNILDNALIANATIITFNAIIKNNYLFISVQDNGRGIPDYVLKNFYLGIPINSKKGMGIGLLLARAAIERGGGTLDLQRIKNSETGTVAKIALPIKEIETES
jgi:two-component system, sensor histidine kinase RegB